MPAILKCFHGQIVKCVQPESAFNNVRLCRHKNHLKCLLKVFVGDIILVTTCYCTSISLQNTLVGYYSQYLQSLL